MSSARLNGAGKIVSFLGGVRVCDRFGVRVLGMILGIG